MRPVTGRRRLTERRGDAVQHGTFRRLRGRAAVALAAAGVVIIATSRTACALDLTEADVCVYGGTSGGVIAGVQAGWEDGWFTLTYTRRKAAQDYEVTPRASGDLGAWSNVVPSLVSDDTTNQVLSVRYPLSVGQSDRGFLGLVIEPR